MKTAKELWQYVSKMGLKPLPKTSVSQWADDYRMLSQGLSAEPGRWKRVEHHIKKILWMLSRNLGSIV